MPLETPPPDNFNALDPTWPTNTDGATVGNEHIQQVKRVLREVFPDNGAPGQFDAPLMLAPAGTTPATGAGTQDAYVRDLDVALNLTVTGGIFGAAEVAIASIVVTPPDESAAGANFGFDVLDRIQDGEWEFKLKETDWALFDLSFGFTSGYGIAGPGTCQILVPLANVGPGWFRITMSAVGLPAVLADPGFFTLNVFDSGRDVP